MTSQAPSSRTELHVRQIEMRAFQRTDGLFEVEGRVTDRKPEKFVPRMGAREVPAGAALHDMRVTIVFDEALKVKDIKAKTDASPYSHCSEAEQTMKVLIGAQMTKGWGRIVRERLGGEKGCTHLMELMMPMATVAFQSLSSINRHKPEALDPTGRPIKINSCFAYGTEQPLVRAYWPEYFLAKKKIAVNIF